MNEHVVAAPARRRRVQFAAKRAVVLLGEAPRLGRIRRSRGAAREAQEREACHYEIDTNLIGLAIYSLRREARGLERHVAGYVSSRLCTRKKRLGDFLRRYSFFLLAFFKRTKLTKSPSSLGARVVKLPADKF